MTLDLLWLGIIAKGLYHRHLGHLMAEKVGWPAALIFYVLYGWGVWFFCVAPASREGSLSSAVLRGAALGLLVYGTYDLTNMAVLRGWGWKIAAVDIVWGVLITAAASAAGYWGSRGL